jgi:hypothetical protein
MQRAVTFLAGMIVGSGLIAAAGPAIDHVNWTREANLMISDHAGVKFTEVAAQPCATAEPCVEHLRIHVYPALRRSEVVEFAQRKTLEPSFRATIGASPDDRATSVVLQIVHPEGVTLVGPEGKPAALCATVK